MPRACSAGTPAAKIVSALTVPSVSCMRCQIVAWRLHGDLLADDVVHDGGKQIRVHRALHRPDTVDDRSQPLVLPAQIRQLGLAVDKIHQPHLLMGLL